MSSHDMSIRSNITVKSGTTLAQILAMLQEFEDEFNCRLSEALADGDFEIPFEDRDNTVSLEGNGHLFVYISFHGSGHGSCPEWIEDLCEKLAEFVQPGGGMVEIIDHDTSASNDESIAYRFIGADNNERIRARLTHGLEVAKEWLVDVIGVDGYASIETLARQLAEQRLTATN